jgi:hypothetical protein
MFVENLPKHPLAQTYISKKITQGGLEAPSPSSTTSTPTTPTVNNAATTSPTTRFVLLATFGFGSVIHKKGIERERVRENKIADVVAANGQGVQRDGITVPHRHLDHF